MTMTTFLPDAELDQPTGDDELDKLIACARQQTGRNYQIVRHREARSRGLLGAFVFNYEDRLQLYVEVPGVGPWQVLTCAQDAATVRAFLYGLLNGVREAKQ